MTGRVSTLLSRPPLPVLYNSKSIVETAASVLQAKMEIS